MRQRTNIYDVPIEVTTWNIAMNSDYEDIINLCKTNPQFTGICHNKKFWIERVRKEPYLPNITVDERYYGNASLTEWINKNYIKFVEAYFEDKENPERPTYDDLIEALALKRLEIVKILLKYNIWEPLADNSFEQILNDYGADRWNIDTKKDLEIAEVMIDSKNLEKYASDIFWKLQISDLNTEKLLNKIMDKDVSNTFPLNVRMDILVDKGYASTLRRVLKKMDNRNNGEILLEIMHIGKKNKLELVKAIIQSGPISYPRGLTSESFRRGIIKLAFYDYDILKYLLSFEDFIPTSEIINFTFKAAIDIEYLSSLKLILSKGEFDISELSRVSNRSFMTSYNPIDPNYKISYTKELQTITLSEFYLALVRELLSERTRRADKIAISLLMTPMHRETLRQYDLLSRPPISLPSYLDERTIVSILDMTSLEEFFDRVVELMNKSYSYLYLLSKKYNLTNALELLEPKVNQNIIELGNL